MRQIWIPKIGEPEVLELREAPDPEPKAGQVRVRVRASGINFDVRKDAPYGAYEKLDFETPTFKEGDSLSRWLVRFEEIKQSISILRQALRDIPQGPIARKAPLVLPKGEEE